MGAYDPDQEHEALKPVETDASEEYFRTYGYGSEYGDGSMAEAGADGEDATSIAKAQARRTAIEWVVVFVGALILALVLRFLFIQAFWIPTSSMESTLLVQDRVLVNKLSYRFGDIERQDIVVFHRTEADLAANPRLHPDVIKRVIAFEGETVEISDNVVYVDGNPLDEPYLDIGTNNLDFGPVTVPEGELFVMGDNREGSADSRSQLGTVEQDRVVGRAFVRFWPLDRLGGL